MTRPLRVRLRIDDPAIAAAAVAAIAAAPGLSLAEADEDADLTLSTDGEAGDDRRQEGQLELSPREREVVALLAEGLSNRAIAERLGIATDTAKFHVGRVIDKLDATGRTDAAVHAARLGLVTL